MHVVERRHTELLIGLWLLFIFSGPSSFASFQMRRDVQMEWEPVEGATSYEIELKPKSISEGLSEAKQTLKFRSQKSLWEGAVPPGLYWLRIRSRDDRGVPGTWSEPSEFHVLLSSVKPLSPEHNASIQTMENEESPVTFRWEKVPLASLYHLEVRSQKLKSPIQKTIKDTEVEISLPVASEYEWSIEAESETGLKSEGIQNQQFLLIGKQLQKPIIEDPGTLFVREIKWSRPDSAESYSGSLDIWNRNTRKWRTLNRIEGTTQLSYPIPSSYRGGRYRISIQANAKNRASSPLSRMAFALKEGDRSEGAQQLAERRKSIERSSGWYFVASYFVTQLNLESGSRIGSDLVQVNQTPLGGTGRLGLGWQTKNSRWGAQGWWDMSGFFFNSETVTFSSMELNAVARYPRGTLDEIRLATGFFRRELPQIRITQVSESNVYSDFTSANVAGPHLGIEYWHPTSQKIGIQMNLQVYYTLINLGTTDLSSLKTEPNLHYGFMASYKLGRNWTGLMGYTLKNDSLYFTGTDGSQNETRLTGHYLSFYTEYYF